MGKLSTFILLLCLVLAACSGSGYSDIDQYMAEVKQKPKGHIDPIPAFAPYKAYVYSAQAMRAPFEKPIQIKEIARLGQSGEQVKPDLNRPREFLESFDIDNLFMVGTLANATGFWVLIRDVEDGVHRVREGNYLGRNHGRVVDISDTDLSVIEIVPDGLGGWIERPRTLDLQEPN